MIPLTRTIYRGSDLPPYEDGTYYIVSAIFCQAFPDRKDFLIVNETIRNEKGEITGCKSLAINPFSASSASSKKEAVSEDNFNDDLLKDSSSEMGWK